MKTLQSELRRSISSVLTHAAGAYFAGEHERAARLRILGQRLRGHLNRLRARQMASDAIRRASGWQ